MREETMRKVEKPKPEPKKKLLVRAEPEIEHGIDGGAYSHEGAGIFTHNLFCLCNFVAEGDSWENAGAILDEHLEEVKE
jgi:hypothetical protein